ncbi:hypothetical protein PF005_g32460 [Phytophthora fragariae]|uniref:Uncharacterized protein n=2 Tax=Phytophthora fragariae TaxID=53985 RepID=A0A6A4B7K7_9STRA|nr:hypothetical protein PF003_g40434 [Phytophthora fragariae]KAE8917282.1 hypothetical protein PF009_g32396 [Phytophthora fragariae]KAE9062701.1 hypothetical protein PF006_g31111 [Phytophthora fragariae]KAE9158425.1 hypothetical protein PF005_g32460 [Phytophthora fragariae]KAE9267931.1 hypothetical protein PF001_g29873 [Phytophthora fragariae]
MKTEVPGWTWRSSSGRGWAVSPPARANSGGGSASNDEIPPIGERIPVGDTDKKDFFADVDAAADSVEKANK